MAKTTPAPRTYALVPYEANVAKRLAWQAAYLAKHARSAPANKAHYHATRELHPTCWPDALSSGQYVGHCGQWQRLTQLPHVCICCGVRLFTEEDMPHG